MTDLDAATTSNGEEVELAHEARTPESPILGELPTVPADGEMRALFQLANIYAASNLVPKALQGKPNDVLLVLMTARDLGLSTTVAVRECHVIDGKVTTSPKLRKAIVTARGIGKVWPDRGNDETSATWYARRADDPEVLYESTFRWSDAQRPTGKARLVGANCRPDQHQPGRNGGCGCKDNWRNYPQRQLSWRALGYIMDDAFSEVGTGLYSPDELGAVVDEDGRPVIDVSEVQVPEGMATPRGREADNTPEPVDPEQLAELRGRIKALPAEARDELKARWAQPRSAEAGGGTMLPTGSDGQPSTGLLDARSIRSASALVAQLERDVERGKYPTASETETSEAGQGPPTDGQMRRLHGLLRSKRGAVGDDRFPVLSELCDRPISSANDLTHSEAALLIDALQTENDQEATS